MKKSAVIYARYSSHTQQEQSIDGQIRVCTEYAKNNDIRIIEHYVDRAKTGTSAISRYEFQRMINDSKTGAFDYIIVYQFDRFARSRHDSVIYKTKLKNNQVRVISATEPSNDTPDSIIIEGMFESLAEYYSADLSKKAKRGIKESVIKRQTIGGAPILGFKIVDKKYAINEDDANVVRDIFKMYSQGSTVREITEGLNRKGLKTLTGKAFGRSSLQQMLSNPKYIGEFYFHGELITDYYPAIIDKTTFNKVQEIRSKNKHKGSKYNRNNREYPLSNLVHCSNCGNELIGTAGTSKTGKRYHYYSCRKCSIKPISAEFLENNIFDELKNYMNSSENIDKLCNFIVDSLKKMLVDTEVVSLKKRLSKIENEIKKTGNAFLNANKAMQEVLNNRVIELVDQKELINKELNKKAFLEKLTPQVEAIKIWLSKLSFETDNKSKVIRLFAKKIFIFEDSALIYLNVDNKVIDYKKALQDFESRSSFKSSHVVQIGRAFKHTSELFLGSYSNQAILQFNLNPS